jgi:iron complex transport system substrate-binding protein
VKAKVVVLFILAIQVFQAPAQQRIITAGSAITETVCALGDCDKIIASDRTSLYPAHIQQLPSIGYRTSINAEGIISLKPTLIIIEKEYVEDAVLQQLSASGIRLVTVDKRVDFNGTKKSISQIAAALGREAEGKRLISKNEKELAEAKTLLQKASGSPKVLCVYNRGTATVSAAGKDTFAGILEYAGAANALTNVEGYKPLNTESLIAANPDYLLFVSTGLESIGGVEGALKIPGVMQTTAGIKKQIISLESLKLTNFGPRFGEAVKELVLLVHPELTAK